MAFYYPAVTCPECKSRVDWTQIGVATRGLRWTKFCCPECGERIGIRLNLKYNFAIVASFPLFIAVLMFMIWKFAFPPPAALPSLFILFILLIVFVQFRLPYEVISLKGKPHRALVRFIYNMSSPSFDCPRCKKKIEPLEVRRVQRRLIPVIKGIKKMECPHCRVWFEAKLSKETNIMLTLFVLTELGMLIWSALYRNYWVFFPPVLVVITLLGAAMIIRYGKYDKKVVAE